MKMIFGKKTGIFMRMTAIAVSAVFFISCLTLDSEAMLGASDAMFDVDLEDLHSPGGYASLDVETFTMPAHLGEVRYSQRGDAARTVIHIQDAHCNYFAQQKVSGVIDYLNKEYGISMLNLEGGAGEYDLTVFTNISGGEIRREVAEYFLKRGEVNGAEFYAINNLDRVSLWGIEDRELYLKNLAVYRDSLRYKEEVEGYLKELRHIFNNLKRHIFTPDLLKMDMAYSSYKAGNMEFREYLSFMIKNARERGISVKTFPNIYLIAQAMEKEDSVDFRKANAERTVLIDRMKSILSSAEMRELVSTTVKFKTKRISLKEFYNYLLGKARECGFDISGYPALSGYIVYVSLFDAVDRFKVMEELDDLERAVKEPLFRSDTERELDILSRNLALTDNIFKIMLTKNDFAYYKSNKDSFSAERFLKFIAREGPRYGITARPSPGISRLDNYLAEIMMFYEYSFARDEAFVENMLFSEVPAGGEAAIIMTGGFHTENLCALFEEQGYSYVSIMPKFTMEKDYVNPYFDLLAGQTADIQQMLSSALAQSSMMQIASMLNNLGEDVWGAEGLDNWRTSVVLRSFILKERGLEALQAGIAGIDVSDTELSVKIKGMEDSPVVVSRRALMDAVHQQYVDAEMEKLPEGAFNDIGDIEGIMAKLKNWLGEAGLGAVADEIDILAVGKNSQGESLARTVEGISFRGHAGGRGIRINADLTGDERDAVILHEIIAGIYGDHFFAERVEEAFLRGETEVDLSRVPDLLDKPVWSMTDEERRTARRDYLARRPAVETPVDPLDLTLDEAIAKKAPWLKKVISSKTPELTPQQWEDLFRIVFSRDLTRMTNEQLQAELELLSAIVFPEVTEKSSETGFFPDREIGQVLSDVLINQQSDSPPRIGSELTLEVSQIPKNWKWIMGYSGNKIDFNFYRNPFRFQNRFLGKGGFASVYGAKIGDEKKEVAVKIFDRQHYYDSDATVVDPAGTGNNFLMNNVSRIREVLVMRYLSGNRGTIGIIESGSFEGADGRKHDYLVMEHGGKSLRSFLDELKTQGRELNPRQKEQIIHQLVQIVRSLHEKGVIHADIKPDNIFVTLDDAGNPKIKLGDFGIALYDPEGKGVEMAATKGTPGRLPREATESRIYGQKTDLYGLATTIFDIAYGKSLREHLEDKKYEGDHHNRVKNAVKDLSKGETPADSDDTFLSDLGKFVSLLLDEDPEKDIIRDSAKANVEFRKFLGQGTADALISGLDKNSKIAIWAMYIALTEGENMNEVQRNKKLRDLLEVEEPEVTAEMVNDLNSAFVGEAGETRINSWLEELKNIAEGPDFRELGLNRKSVNETIEKLKSRNLEEAWSYLGGWFADKEAMGQLREKVGERIGSLEDVEKVTAYINAIAVELESGRIMIGDEDSEYLLNLLESDPIDAGNMEQLLKPKEDLRPDSVSQLFMYLLYNGYHGELSFEQQIDLLFGTFEKRLLPAFIGATSVEDIDEILSSENPITPELINAVVLTAGFEGGWVEEVIKKMATDHLAGNIAGDIVAQLISQGEEATEEQVLTIIDNLFRKAYYLREHILAEEKKAEEKKAEGKKRLIVRDWSMFYQLLAQEGVYPRHMWNSIADNFINPALAAEGGLLAHDNISLFLQQHEQQKMDLPKAARFAKNYVEKGGVEEALDVRDTGQLILHVLLSGQGHFATNMLEVPDEQREELMRLFNEHYRLDQELSDKKLSEEKGRFVTGQAGLLEMKAPGEWSTVFTWLEMGAYLLPGLDTMATVEDKEAHADQLIETMQKANYFKRLLADHGEDWIFEPKYIKVFEKPGRLERKEYERLLSPAASDLAPVAGNIGKFMGSDGQLKTEGFTTREENGFLVVSHKDPGAEVSTEVKVRITPESPDLSGLAETLEDLMKPKDGIPSTLTEDERKEILKIIQEITDKKITVKAIAMDERVMGHFGVIEGERVIYLNQELLGMKSPKAKAHAMALAHEMIHGSPGLAVSGINAHTVAKGVGEEPRIGLEVMIERGVMDFDRALNIGDEGFINELNKTQKEIELRELTRDEENLIKHNFEKIRDQKIDFNIAGRIGPSIFLYGLQDHMDPAGNLALTTEIRFMQDNVRKGVRNIVCNENDNYYSESTTERYGRKMSRKYTREGINTSYHSFDGKLVEKMLERVIDEMLKSEKQFPAALINCVNEATRDQVNSLLDTEKFRDFKSRIKVSFSQNEGSASHFENIPRLLHFATQSLNYTRLKVHFGMEQDDPFMRYLASEMIEHFGRAGYLDMGVVSQYRENPAELLAKLFTGALVVRITLINYEEIRDYISAMEAVYTSL
jgi:serine/threonine protein kinase